MLLLLSRFSRVRLSCSFWLFCMFIHSAFFLGRSPISFVMFFFYLIRYFFSFYFWLSWVFVAAYGLSLDATISSYSSCSMRASCSGFLVVERRLWSARASVVVVHGLSCHAACWVLVPWPGIEPISPALQGGFLITGPLGKPLVIFLKGFNKG